MKPFPLVPVLILSLVQVSQARETGIDLTGAVARARKSSAELSWALFDLGVDETRCRLSWRHYLPAISLGYTRNTSVVYYGPDSRNASVSVGLSGTVYDRGARRHDLERKRMDLRLKRKLFEIRERELYLTVAGAYAELLGYRIQEEIMGETLESARMQARISAEELRTGEITEVDHLTILARVKDLELEEAGHHLRRKRLLYEFALMMGGNGDEGFFPEGRLDHGYPGFVKQEDAGYYLDAAEKNSAALLELAGEMYSLGEILRREERSGLPSVSTRMELFVSGREFPLSRPGFTLGIGLAWNNPILPFSAGATAGSRNPFERSLGTDGSLRLADDLEGLLSAEIARVNLHKAGVNHENAIRNLRYSIREELAEIEREAGTLNLLREKQAIGERKLEIQAVLLKIGDITRLDFVEEKISLARIRMDILTSIIRLSGRESALLHACGIPGLSSRPLPMIFGETPR